LNRFTFEQEDGSHEPPMASKIVGVKLKRGQHVRIESPGGGGYGPVAQREPAAIARDLRLGYITPDGAQRDYAAAMPKRAAE
ncbi:MAG TPA: hydantoinase B/oxoprolinase family protein, partial [Stellaceae bacterium]